METTTPFDLNRAVQRWRENLTQSPAFSSENLNELESHLRDSIATLQTRGLSAEEGFVVATMRIGKKTLLEKEFGKVNEQAIWLDRCLWILFAFQAWGLISRAATYVFTGLGVSQISEEYIRAVFGVLMSPFAIALAAGVVWRFFIRPKKVGHNFFRKLPLRRGSLALTLFLSSVIFMLVGLWTHFFLYPLIFDENLRFYGWTMTSNLPADIILALLTFLVARKRLRASKA